MKEEEFYKLSFRYHKDYKDYGFTKINDDLYKDKEGNYWENTGSFDFGWGEEIGYSRLPKLSFADNFLLLLKSKSDNNFYGAAAYLLKYDCEKLFDYLSDSDTVNILILKYGRRYIKKRFRWIHLSNITNFFHTLGKDYEEICKDSDRSRQLIKLLKSKKVL